MNKVKPGYYGKTRLQLYGMTNPEIYPASFRVPGQPFYGLLSWTGLRVPGLYGRCAVLYYVTALGTMTKSTDVYAVSRRPANAYRPGRGLRMIRRLARTLHQDVA